MSRIRQLSPLLLLTISGALSALAADPAVPPPVTAARFGVLLERPPFRRALGLPDSLVLSGVAAIPGGHMVTVWNRATKESFMVTATPNAQGWRLASLTENASLRNVAAVIASGDQSITVRFDPERLTPPKLDNMSRPAGRSESQVVVEALLRGLDPLSAKVFEGLKAEEQESFRKAFAGYLDTYPGASNDQRTEFVRRSLAEISAPVPPPAPASSPAGAASAPAAAPVPPTPPQPQTPSPAPAGN
jgi:hypothetical protein